MFLSSGGGSSRITAGCLFAGMGGFCSGMSPANIKTLWANENDKYAAVTFRANYPDVRMIEKDVRELSVEKDQLEPVDILSAGFPCQSFSIAGYRLGFDDERGRLFFEIIRLIGEFGKRKPKILLLENVPHLANGDDGRWLDKIIYEIQRAGYWFDRSNCRILKTDEISGVPQGRRRLFMVATSRDAFDSNDYIYPESKVALRPLDEFIDRSKKAEQKHYLQPDKRIYKIIDAGMNQNDVTGICQFRRSYVKLFPLKCPTLTANMGKGGGNVPHIRDRWGIRRLTVDECVRLQGFDNFVFPPKISDSQRYKQIGNATSPLIVDILIRGGMM